MRKVDNPECKVISLIVDDLRLKFSSIVVDSPNYRTSCICFYGNFFVSFFFQSLAEFFKLLKGNLIDEEKSIIALSFDVMWAILTALSETSQRYPLRSNTKLKGSLQLTYYFKKQLQNVSFEGFTVIDLSLLHKHPC